MRIHAKIHTNTTLQSGSTNKLVKNFIKKTATLCKVTVSDGLNAKNVYISSKHSNFNSQVSIAIQICHNGRHSKPFYISLLHRRTSRHSSKLGKVARCNYTIR